MSAIISDCGHYRYRLERHAGSLYGSTAIIMVNPSTADANKDDPTIIRLCRWAKLWGYGGLLVVNLYSLRSSDPHHVRGNERDAYGPSQSDAIGHALAIADSQGSPVLAAWGNLANDFDIVPFREAAVGIDLICLGKTMHGDPKHPMARGKHRISDNQQPMPWPC